LNWTDTTTSTVYNTYCVDISSVIGIGDWYYMNQESLGSLPTSPYNGNVIDGIETLVYNNYSGFYDTLFGLGSLDTATEAAELQIALWDIIYNPENATTLYDGSQMSSPLYFSHDSTDLGTALGLANAAYGKGAPANNSGLMAFQAVIGTALGDNGQNQIFLTLNISPTGDSNPVPLPTTASTSVALLCGMGGFAAVRRRLAKVS
jgi:hypothetical protein